VTPDEDRRCTRSRAGPVGKRFVALNRCGISSICGGYPARDNSGRRVLSAAGCRCGRRRVPSSRVDRLRAPRNALLDHERSAQTGAPAIFLAILTVDGGPSPRSIAYLPDRTPSRISRSRASNYQELPGGGLTPRCGRSKPCGPWAGNASPSNSRVSLVYPFASVLPRANRAAVGTRHLFLP